MNAPSIAQGGDHVPHVLPVKTYLKTWAALLVLTAVTVGASYVDLGRSGNAVVALLIAAVKATTVAAVFMHLWYDKKFNSVVLMMSGLFLAIMIIFTMADTETRGSEDPSTQSKPKDMKQPFPKAAAPAAAPAAAAPAAAAPAASSAAPAAGSAAPAASSAAPAAGSAAPAAGSAAPAAGSAVPTAGSAAPAAGSAAPAAP